MNRLVKWFLIVVGLLGLLVIGFVVYSVIYPPGPEMLGSAQIWPGGMSIHNENDFPWYGMVVTIEGKYSTKHHLDDPNWGFISPDSVLLPGESQRIDITAFVDSDSNEYEGPRYTGKLGLQNVKRITVEAKTEVDGRYNMKMHLE